jgi:hypothetical protein
MCRSSGSTTVPPVAGRSLKPAESACYLALAGAAAEAEKPKDRVMTDISTRTDEESLLIEVSDEALELGARAGREQSRFTLGSCTGLSECPGQPA